MRVEFLPFFLLHACAYTWGTMLKLNSSSIKAVDYDPTRRHLRIWFPNNGPYTYYGVPERIYLRLVQAVSPGTFYNEVIRGNYSA